MADDKDKDGGSSFSGGSLITFIVVITIAGLLLNNTRIGRYLLDKFDTAVSTIAPNSNLINNATTTEETINEEEVEE